MLHRQNGLATIAILFLFVFFSSSSFADSLTLKNGDTVSGRINRIENHVVYLQTDYAGEILISTTEVAGLKTNLPVKVDYGDGKERIGKVEVSPNKQIRFVTTTEIFEFNPDKIALMTPLSEVERKTSRFERPRVWDHEMEIGAQVRTGNSSEQDIYVGYGSEMTNEHVNLNNDLTAGFGWAKGDRTTQQVLGESRLDWSHTNRFYSFYSVNAQHDLFKSLYLRAREEAGVGYKFIKTGTTLLQGDVGLGLNEDFLKNASDDIDPLGHLGLLFTQKIGKSSEFGLRWVMLPDFGDIGEYFMDSEAWVQTPISERFFLKISVLDRFDSSPPPFVKENDVTIKTSVGVTF